jgi:hypothetical protein
MTEALSHEARNAGVFSVRESRLAVAQCFWTVLVLVFLVGCSKAQSSAELTDAFRRAHDRRDMASLLQLFCWDRVTPELKQQTEELLRRSIDTSIIGVKLSTNLPKQRVREFVMGGVTYGLNLQEVADLVVSYQPATPGSTSEDHYAVGMRNGHYRIALMAPVAPGSPSASSRQSVANLNAGTSNSGPARSVIVPKGTLVVVRLAQDVGLSTMSGGGSFTAAVKEPVVVNGIAAIPTEAAVEGAVTKTGNYSPEMFLTSITINGKRYTIKTVHSIFNEAVVFPAGSERAFELITPLELNN